MRPFPPELQAAFPQTNLPARPWWRRSTHTHSTLGVVYERRLSVRNAEEWMSILILTDGVRDVCMGIFGTPEEVNGLSLEAAMAVLDAREKAPHPGFRAGQVWANAIGESVTIAEVTHDLPNLHTHRRPYDTPSFSAAYPFLLADPACPHLAPWSPT